MNHETVWTINPLKLNRSASGGESSEKAASSCYARHPGIAFSLSLIFWGAGQIYNRQIKLGVLLLLLMANFYAFLFLVISYWKPILAFGKSASIGMSGVLLAWGGLHTAGLALWIGNAIHAYLRAGRLSGVCFRGVESPLWPGVCSAMLPGWGQFLNGQHRKGAIFLTLFGSGIFAFPAIFVIYLHWPEFQTAAERLLWEKTMIGQALLIVAVLFVWPFVVFDAVKVGLDEVKKEPLLKRIEYANNLRRMRGWIEGYFPQAKLTLMLALFLTLCITYSHHYFPRIFYARSLAKLEIHLKDRGMTVIPLVIEDGLNRIGFVRNTPK